MPLLMRLVGMFPLPGAPRQQPMDASRLQAFMAQPSGNATTTALKPLNARQSKRLFVSNLPASATDDSIIQFFNLQLNNLNVTSANDPCISAQISKDRSFALLEFRAPGDATVGLALDGIHMESHAMDSRNGSSNGSSGGLTIRRPKDYIVPSVTEDSEESSASYKGGVPDTPNKISITNIPSILTDEQISELLVTFGELKAFVLVKENGTEESRVSLFSSITLPTNFDTLKGHCILRVCRPSRHRYCSGRAQWDGDCRQEPQGPTSQHWGPASLGTRNGCRRHVHASSHQDG